MEATVFNPAQLYLLEVFSHIKTDEELLDIKKLISDYYARKMDKILDEMWQSGELRRCSGATRSLASLEVLGDAKRQSRANASLDDSSAGGNIHRKTFVFNSFNFSNSFNS